MKLTLTRVIRKDTNKEGKPLITKDGRPYSKINIQCQEYGQKWLSGFSNGWNEWWKDGSVVEAEVKTVTGDDGKEYLNLEKPDPVAALAEQVNRLTSTLATLKDLPERVKALEAFMRSPQPGMTKAENVKEDDLPF